MDKKRYYISVQAGTILEKQGDAAYELEIEATPEEVDKLSEVFEELDNFDQASFTQAATSVTIAYHLDESNDGYDFYLNEAYSMIYDLGTEETKQHIKSMKILT